MTSGRRCAKTRAQNVLLPVNTSAWRCSATFSNPSSERVSRLCTAAGARLHQLAQHLPKLLFHGRPRGERGVAFHGIAPRAGRVRLQQPLELLQILLEGRRHALARGGSAIVIRALQSATTFKSRATRS